MFWTMFKKTARYSAMEQYTRLGMWAQVVDELLDDDTNDYARMATLGCAVIVRERPAKRGTRGPITVCCGISRETHV